MKTITDRDFLKFIGKQEQQHIGGASQYTDDTILRLSQGPRCYGQKLPWSNTHDTVRIRPGEVSVWAGINGHGKSTLCGNVVLWMLPYQRTCLASMEMPPPATLAKLLRQAAGCENPSESYVRSWIDWCDQDRLWIYDQTDSVEPERILGMVHYCGQELGITQMVIDCLAKCGINTDDYNKQKNFVDQLCWAAKQYAMHIHLIHHLKKGEREGKRPDKFDVKGAGEITDLVDNVFLIHRNKDKERQVEAGGTVDDGVPDARFMVEKQRHGEWEGTVALYFHKASQQFMGRPSMSPMPWPNPDEPFQPRDNISRLPGIEDVAARIY